MTTIHVHCIGDQALLPQSELEQLIALAQRSEAITVQRQEEEVPTLGIMRLIEQGGACDFWKEDGEDLYAAAEGAPV